MASYQEIVQYVCVGIESIESRVKLLFLTKRQCGSTILKMISQTTGEDFLNEDVDLIEFIGTSLHLLFHPPSLKATDIINNYFKLQ